MPFCLLITISVFHADAVEKGKRGLFSGYANFKQLMFVKLPVFVMLFGAAVAATTRSSSIWSCREGLHVGLHSPLPCHSMLASPVLGASLVVLNRFSGDLFKKGGCIDPLLHTTLAPVEANSAYQWTYVILNCTAMIIIGSICFCLQKHCPKHKAYVTQKWLRRLASQLQDRAQCAVDVWRSKTLQPGKVKDMGTSTLCGTMMHWIRHVPFVCLAMAPSAGYVECALPHASTERLLVAGVSFECACW